MARFHQVSDNIVFNNLPQYHCKKLLQLAKSAVMKITFLRIQVSAKILLAVHRKGYHAAWPFYVYFNQVRKAISSTFDHCSNKPTNLLSRLTNKL